ncbi:META domain-containing protein [Zobellella sp. DQSA1]|uniref:META domain-containing protein n=1 Tax=Zobellella sp. DQSA1 TaxID=3342386 RepID=UPI0035C20896
MKSSLYSVLLLPLVLLLSACANPKPGGWQVLAPGEPELSFTGLVHYLELEGGLYLIRDAGGTNYHPINLPDAFRRDGLAVEVEARRRDDLLSIGMVGPMIELLRIRRTEPEPTAPLPGSQWRLEDLGGRGVLDRVPVTLAFPEPGRVAGFASCNLFGGSADIDGEQIRIGGLVATQKSCTEAVEHQERRYLAALAGTERFTTLGPFLYLHGPDYPQPLKFIRIEEEERLMGDWTITAHHLPGIGAMSEAEAAAWHGRRLQLRFPWAEWEGERCEQPRYRLSSLEPGSLLADYRLAPGSLPSLESAPRPQRLEIACDQQPWLTLLVPDQQRLLLPRDGTFFELRRNDDH